MAWLVTGYWIWRGTEFPQWLGTDKSDPISWPQNQREIIKYINWQQFTKGTRGKPNEQLFPRQVVIQLPKYVTYISFFLSSYTS